MRAGGALMTSGVQPSQPAFIPGLTLNGRFYREIVRPLLAAHLPWLDYSAALIGYGSDVLGYDTAQSRDHNWGPRLQLFVPEEGREDLHMTIGHLLRKYLPTDFLGYSVGYTPPNPSDNGTQRLAATTAGDVNHLVEVTTLNTFFRRYLNIECAQTLDSKLWLCLPEQKLLEVTSGLVFHDGLQHLHAARARFAYYPRAIWLTKLAAQWRRIAEEEPFLGRTGDVGDDLGSWVIAARLTRDMMRLGFLYARRYAPYSKWLGTAFGRLPFGHELRTHFTSLARDEHWRDREAHYIAAICRLAKIHNALGITPALPAQVTYFFNRPYRVLFADRFADAIAAEIDDPLLRRYADIGAVDQFTDCVPIHSHAARGQVRSRVRLTTRTGQARQSCGDSKLAIAWQRFNPTQLCCSPPKSGAINHAACTIDHRR